MEQIIINPPDPNKPIDNGTPPPPNIVLNDDGVTPPAVVIPPADNG